MSGHRFNTDAGAALQGGAVIADPGTGGTIALKGRNFGVCRAFGAGSYKLPDVTTKQVGTMVIIVADAAQTWRNSASTLRATMVSGDIAIAIAISTTDWKIDLTNGSAELLTFVDSIDYYPTNTVEAGFESAAVWSSFPNAKFTTRSAGTETAGSGHLTGARFVAWKNTANGAVSLTTRTATQMYTDMGAGLFPQQSFPTFVLRIISGGDNTVTLLAGGGVTLTGTATAATTKFRDFAVTFQSATAATFQDIGGS